MTELIADLASVLISSFSKALILIAEQLIEFVVKFVERIPLGARLSGKLIENLHSPFLFTWVWVATVSVPQSQRENLKRALEDSPRLIS